MELNIFDAPGVSGAGTTSEYVRQELRAVVGARTGQSQPGASRAQSQMLNQNVTVPADLEALGLTFEMPPAGKLLSYLVN